MNKSIYVNIIGGGLAGTEAAYQLLKEGINVRLYEMRPEYQSPAHKTGKLAELVCSNTFKSMSQHSAPGIFKEELKILDSLILKCAPVAQVPAGEALAVDRDVFSDKIEATLNSFKNFCRFNEQVNSIENLPEAYCTIIATGPLTQGGLAENIKNLSSGHGLYFYDAIAPVVSADSIDESIAFRASRYDKGGNDYINCPFTKDEYLSFYAALMSAEKTDYHDFEEAKFFQGCQPIEAIAETGIDSLRFGAMKPVGLDDPRTGKRPYAVVQLRVDNISKSAFNIVGFQTKLKYPEQKKVFSLIPGLKNAEFLRLGSMHRNSFICTPTLLNSNFSLKTNHKIRFAGQVTGVEGYTESSAVGLLCAKAIIAELQNKVWNLPPRGSILGSLLYYIFNVVPSDFQPVNVNFGLLNAETFKTKLEKKQDKREFRILQGKECISNINQWNKITN